MNIFSELWLNSSFLFDPVQRLFNGSFWTDFASIFQNFTDRKIIDLACGTGEMRNHVNPKKYLGVDINPAYIDYNQKRYNLKDTFFCKRMLQTTRCLGVMILPF